MAIVILAAGLGTRMRSALPKVMHVAAGRTLIGHVLAAAASLDPDRVIVVKAPADQGIGREIGRYLPRAVTADQHERRGTGHAVMTAGPALAGFSGAVLVLFGDCPNIRPKRWNSCLRRSMRETPLAVLGVRGGRSLWLRTPDRERRAEVSTAIREELDASPKERAIGLCNSGIMAVDVGAPRSACCRRSAPTTPRARSI